MQRKGACTRAAARWFTLPIVTAVTFALAPAALHADRETTPRRHADTPAAAEIADVAGGAHANEGAVAGEGPVIGPDVICSVIDGVMNYTETGAIDGMHAYAVGTTSCNLGDAEAVWVQATNQHPVIAQSLFRHSQNRIEQIGQSWLKHGFCAVNGTNFCTTCQPTDPVCPALGIGCSDTYGPSLNGQWIYLGPKYDVNAATGEFSFPHVLPTGDETLRGRLLAAQDDVDPALNPNARYYVQAQYVTTDEQAWGTQYNNCSYRRVNFDETSFALAHQGPTIAQQPAIMQWAVLNEDVEVTIVDIPGDGRLYLASDVTQINPNQWAYEYALFNMNSDRAISWLRLPIEPGAAVSQIGFHDVDYHSGEPFSGADWDIVATYAAVTWRTEPFAVNENANALRWGTLYNFRLIANVPPTAGNVVLGLFKPPTTAGSAGLSIEVAAPVPGVVDVPLICPGDIVNNVTFQPPPDGAVDGADLAATLGAWGLNAGSHADFISAATFQPPPDGVVDAADLALLLGNWGPCD